MKKTKTKTEPKVLKNASEKAQPFIAELNQLFNDVNNSLTPSILQDAETTFLVIGPGYYGYGNSIKTAKLACIQAGCPRNAKMLVFAGDDDIGVNGLGQISAPRYLIGLGEV